MSQEIYRPWFGSITEDMKAIGNSPKEITAIAPMIRFYTTLENASEACIGFNEVQLESEETKFWAVVFKQGEEPKQHQLVELRKLSELN